VWRDTRAIGQKGHSPSAIVELVQFSEKTVTFLLVRDWVLVENFGHSEDKILRAHTHLITHFGPWRPSVGRESAHNTSLGQYLGGRATERRASERHTLSPSAQRFVHAPSSLSEVNAR
jgi:hypothetical protein